MIYKAHTEKVSKEEFCRQAQGLPVYVVDYDFDATPVVRYLDEKGTIGFVEMAIHECIWSDTLADCTRLRNLEANCETGIAGFFICGELVYIYHDDDETNSEDLE